MTKIIAIALLLASAAAFPAPAFADSSSNPLCGPDGPEGYKRPGGYCEQIDKKDSLMPSSDCDYRQLETTLVTLLAAGETILVADNCYSPPAA